jgi:very-short-patch-repair endonuclease
MLSNETIEQQLAVARRDLLELTIQNRLLNTPRDQERGAGVEIKDEVSAEIFRMLVKESQTMQFEQGELDDDVATGTKKRRTTKVKPTTTEPLDMTKDSILHTELEPTDLDGRLASLVTDSTASLQEKGVNILYLALGFLRWYEKDKPDKPRDAPLLLVPVTLERNKAGVRYSLKYTGDDVAMNLTLQVRLKVDFGIDLPEIPDVEDLSPDVYFRDVAQAVASQSDFEVLANDIVLWFFSFTKLLMFRDLDPDSWPQRKLLDRPLMRALLQDSFPPAAPLCNDDGRIDDLFDPAQTAHVIDCDASQALVIEEACRGRSLVIQGPPGTGKSQTITNLIAAAVASGKTILFVAEKMAALEVVKRRLDNIGLGDMCLELHSKLASKRSVVQEIERVLSLGTPQKPAELNETVNRLKATRDQLNQHVDRMHQPIEPFQRSPYEILTELIELRARGTQLPDFQLPEAVNWNRQQYQNHLTAVTDLSSVIGQLKDPAQHPWRGSNLDQILPLDLERLLVAAPKQIESLDELTSANRNLSQRLGDEPPTSLEESDRLLRTIRALLAAPELDPQPMNGMMWRDHRNAVQELADAGRALTAARKTLDGKVTEAAWDTELGASQQAYATYGQSTFRMFRSSYRAARRQLKSLLVGPQPHTFEERLEVLNLLQSHYKAKKVIAEGDSVGQKAFGRFWLGLKTDWQRIAAWEQWDAETACSGASTRFREMLSLLDKPDEIRQLSDVLDQRLQNFVSGFGALGDALRLDYDAAFATSIKPEQENPRLEKFGKARTASLTEIRERIKSWLDNPEGLQHWQTYRRSRATATEIGSGVLVQRIESGQIAAQQAPDMFRFAIAETQLRHVLKQYPELESFSGGKFEQLIKDFSNLDIRRLELARNEVADAHWQSIGRNRGGDLAAAVAVLKHEMQKKRRHLPLRQLLNRAGVAVQAVKPVFMMSPLSVAQFLEAGTIEFDMLLIDEASQVRPVEALGAAARCRQMVVVGDDKQMPPTQFFGMVLGEVSEEDSSLDMTAGDVESILSLCIARNMPQRMLRWHYRSKHESLIAVSNDQFYDRQLFVIPSPEQSGDLGVKFHFVPDGRFIKGSNLVEAKVVAQAIMRHAKEHPKWTLGVGAFSVSQRDLILKELEALRREDLSCEAFFDPNAPDPFFVKNLENIQGDERDVIFVSVGYGPGEDGKVSLNFGPVSSSGGERRLNVLMTRAKRVCEIFASMKAEDIDLNRATGKGPAVFREYLKFAQMGGTVKGAKGTGASDRFVEVLSKILTERGYHVQANVGIAGLFIDLAVSDPDNPGKFLLGIDLDGDSYRLGRWARDRDRTRQGVLEGQGWNMYRVWSLEWFRRPTEELNRLIAAIESAKRGGYERSGPRLASNVTQIARKTGGLDPLTASVGEVQPVPERTTQANEAPIRGSDIFGSVVKLGAKVGVAVLTADKGKGLDAAISALNEDNRPKPKKK